MMTALWPGTLAAPPPAGALHGCPGFCFRRPERDTLNDALNDALAAFTWLEETERLITLRTALPVLNLVASRPAMREAGGQGMLAPI